MPASRTPPSWRDVQRGVAYLAALTVLAAAVFSIDVIQRRLLEGPTLVVTTGEARGLLPGAEVWVAGVSAGRVATIRFRDPGGPAERRVEIEAVLRRRAPVYLREDATARVTPSALLAPVVLALEPGTAGRPRLRRDTLQAESGVDPDTLAARLAAARAAADSFATRRRRLRDELRGGRGTLAALARDPQPVERLADGLRRLRALLRGEGGSLRRLAADPGLRTGRQRIRHHLADVEASSRARAASMARVRAALARLGDRVGRVQAGLAAGRGTAGRAVSDRELQDQLRRLQASVDSARAELTADPLRWLRFRLF